MAGRGPPKKPTQLKVIEGNPGGKDLPRHEPQAAALVDLAPPKELRGRIQRQTWARIVPKLHALGTLAAVDTEALVLYCEERAVYAEAMAIVRKEGVVLRATPAPAPGADLFGAAPAAAPADTRLSVRKHPALTAAHEAAAVLKHLLASFGMTPSSRAGIETLDPSAPGEAWDEFEQSAG